MIPGDIADCLGLTTGTVCRTPTRFREEEPLAPPAPPESVMLRPAAYAAVAAVGG